jgi:hypothetical protein
LTNLLRLLLLLTALGFTPAALAEVSVQADERHATQWPVEDSPVDLEVYLSAPGTRGFVSFLRPDQTRWTSQIFPMWKARTADLDGSGEDELLLGIWSRMRRHDEPSPHRAIWVMGYRADHLYPIWQGSALSRPLIDFEVADLSGDGVFELLAIETLDGQCSWAVYRWNGFGFWAAARDEIPCGATFGPEPQCVTVDEEQRCARWQEDEWILR